MRVLITGTSSYIGTSFAEFAKRNDVDYTCNFVSVRSGEWEDASFSGYDAILHVAGIAHRKETSKNKDLYFEVNRDLTLAVARKAAAEGVRQFVFISTGAVYGSKADNITVTTQPNPSTAYGQSKLEAEKGLLALETSSFSVAIIRPLMVYGKGCKGNFQSLLGIVRRAPIFPDYHNKRSLIYIDNLSSFLKRVIDEGCRGIFTPQNREFADTRVIAEEAAKSFGKTIYFSRSLGICVGLLKNINEKANKAFGDMKYIGDDVFDYSYCVCDFRESIRRSI